MSEHEQLTKCINIRRSSRFQTSSLERLVKIFIAENPGYFLKHQEQLQILAPPLRAELADFAVKYRGNTTPDAIPLLLELGVTSVKIDCTECRNAKDVTWTREQTIKALKLISKAGNQVVKLSLKLCDATWLPNYLSGEDLIEHVFTLSQLRSLELDCYVVSDEMFQLLPSQLQSLYLLENIQVDIRFRGFNSLVSRCPQLVHLDISGEIYHSTPQDLLVALEKLPHLQVLRHRHLESAVILYLRKHGNNKPLNLTLFHCTNSNTAPHTLNLLPKLEELYLECKVPDRYLRKLKCIVKLHTTLELDDLVNLWGKKLLVLEVDTPFGNELVINITQVAHLCPNLQQLFLTNVTLSDAPYLDVILTPGQHFQCLEVLDLLFVQEATSPLCKVALLSSPQLRQVKLCNEDLSQYMEVTLQNTCFPNLEYINFELSKGSEELFRCICTAPYLRKFRVDMSGCINDEEIIDQINNHPVISKELYSLNKSNVFYMNKISM